MTSAPRSSACSTTTVAHLARVLLATGNAAAAEPLARESMAVFEAHDPDDWRRFSVQNLAGGCRLAAGDPAAAESLVRQGYAGMAERASRIPAIDQLRLREALERLTALAAVQNRPDELTRWRRELEKFDRGLWAGGWRWRKPLDRDLEVPAGSPNHLR